MTTIIKSFSFYCHQNNREKKDPSPILCIIHTVTIRTMLNFNGGDKGQRIKDITALRGLIFRLDN